MARKYRVTTKCYGCGRIYQSNASPGKSPPNRCKHCGSSSTYSLEAKPV